MSGFSGMGAWLLQRLTAVYLVVFTVWAGIRLALADPWSYAAWSGWLGEPVNAALAWLFGVSLLAHAWVGGRDVLIDYIHPLGLRLALLSLLAGWLLGSGLVFTALVVSA